MSLLKNLYNKSIENNNIDDNRMQELNKLYKNIIEKNNNITNHKELIELFNLNPENPNARKFAGLINEGKNGLDKHKNQLIVFGQLLNDLENANYKQASSFIKEALAKDEQDKLRLGENITNNNDKYIDLKFFILETLKNPQISNINSIGALGLLKEVLSMDNVKSKNQVIHNDGNSANLKPLMDKIEQIQETNPTENDISNLNTISAIVESMFNNKENEEKLKEIRELMNSINQQFQEQQRLEQIKQNKALEEENINPFDR